MTETSSTRLSPGDQAPGFTLNEQNGEQVSLSDYAGQRVIVYFYPAAGTPGCTKQACDFRDQLASFTSEGFAVLGISPDKGQKLANFAEKEQLTFPLLSDPDHQTAASYGAWGEKKNYGRVSEGLIRSTIVVDADGLVELAQYNVKATGHVAKLRRDLKLDAA